jgi:predicted DsbA family dithiol-disulfide isomerase
VTERVRFHFDPICPWCYQTSRWIRRLAELGEIELSWGLYSLEIVNAGDDESTRKGHARSGPSLRTAQLVGEELGSEALGAFYATLGRRVHEEGAPLDDETTIVEALREADVDPSYLEKALADDTTWDRVREQHEALVSRTRSFGVPTIVLDGGEGPAIFGPVISEVPTDEDAVELFRHVAWLTRYENFSELKRDRTVRPDLESVRRKATARRRRRDDEGGERSSSG